ncbi:uncharacterized protein BDZ83DRAFT_96157 [Colletotrichum acutatum]|uniref:Uncharacterized protein n=1 Tax=Glomerella acutata TaxID=27357 RepID=A0AAD8X9S6_GLOAC|nr:uncharacterized protein BDZ83DRAFT_96157 [Colletotrichum acutatum]KAK1712565.1 hypothetical protein BDZ83DRAFT_96157 [Colletotrichum acutatum]
MHPTLCCTATEQLFFSCRPLPGALFLPYLLTFCDATAVSRHGALRRLGNRRGSAVEPFAFFFFPSSSSVSGLLRNRPLVRGSGLGDTGLWITTGG